jgi:hypothetical protein
VVTSLHFNEFANDRRLLWIAEEWERYSDRLAEWAMERLVNRRDVWSQYTLKNGEIGVVMLPIKERRVKGAHMVTDNKLRRHFAGHQPNHLIGLHSISDHSTCKWFAVDVDLHNEAIVDADEIAAANFTAALTWATRLRDMGMDPLLMDSNGVGGYHVWTLMDKEYPLADTFDFVAGLRDDYADFSLPRKPEVFPPKREVKEDDLPYTLRLPGRHHTRRHYSRVWNFDALGENEWLEGGEAIEMMLAAVPSRLPKIGKKASVPSSKAPEKGPAKKTAAKKPGSERKRKPRVCVDLDGVIASYKSWKGFGEIGSPLPGALEFITKLSTIADVVIFTSRCSLDPGADAGTVVASPEELRGHVVDWLRDHDFPFADVYIGQGKPKAAAFIDDRAIACRPQEEPDAFDTTLKAVTSLLKKK